MYFHKTFLTEHSTFTVHIPYRIYSHIMFLTLNNTLTFNLQKQIPLHLISYIHNTYLKFMNLLPLCFVSNTEMSVSKLLN